MKYRKNFTGYGIRDTILYLCTIFYPVSRIPYLLMRFTSKLITWYHRHKRDLPFRGTCDPYLIWVSEVILQQTRMEQGLGYYLRFVERFPDMVSLASADEEEVLKLWQGLGYYSRARNLHETARKLVKENGGQFPKTYKEIRNLKGIGDYSAASIASLSFGEPYPAVDGNVYRFLARFFGIKDPAGSGSGKKRAVQLSSERIDRKNPGAFNQAMIEFGALVCKPANPACQDCIFRSGCYAFTRNIVDRLPVRSKQTKIRRRYFNYLVITDEQKGAIRIHLHKRTGNDIWENLYDFPLIETTRKVSLKTLFNSEAFRSYFPERLPEISHVSEEFRHILSHQIILARFFRVSLKGQPARISRPVTLDEIRQFPVPRLITLYLQKYFA
ncbi:MAG: A/G-specific adenine glycosylase [bacterium]